jgi:hypothetical protein
MDTVWLNAHFWPLLSNQQVRKDFRKQLSDVILAPAGVQSDPVIMIIQEYVYVPASSRKLQFIEWMIHEDFQWPQKTMRTKHGTFRCCNFAKRLPAGCCSEGVLICQYHWQLCPNSGPVLKKQKYGKRPFRHCYAWLYYCFLRQELHTSRDLARRETFSIFDTHFMELWANHMGAKLEKYRDKIYSISIPYQPH